MLGALQRAAHRGCSAGLGAVIGAVAGWLVGPDLAFWCGASGGAAAASVLDASALEGRGVAEGGLAALIAGALAASAALGVGWLPEVAGTAGSLEVLLAPWVLVGLAAAGGPAVVRAAEAAMWALGDALDLPRAARPPRVRAGWDAMDHLIAGLAAGLVAALVATGAGAVTDRTVGPLLGAATLGQLVGALRASPPASALRWGILLGGGPRAGSWIGLDAGATEVFGGDVDGVGVGVPGSEGLVAALRCDPTEGLVLAPYARCAVRVGGEVAEGEGVDLAAEVPLREGQRLGLGGLVGRVYRRPPWRAAELRGDSGGSAGAAPGWVRSPWRWGRP